jgi:penicillin-binding protein 2
MSELLINPGTELRNSRLELYHFKLRLAIMLGFVLLMFFLLFTRFFWLQVVEQKHYSTLAEANRIAIVPVVANRGLIVDRNGVILADNFSAYTLEIEPNKVGNLQTLIDELSTIIDITAKDRRRFQEMLVESKLLDSVPIRTRLSDEEVARFASQAYRFPGVAVNARPFRQYPQGELFSHVIGHIGRINERELGQLAADGLNPDNYRGSDYIGKTGLERSYEQFLRGTTGIEEVEVDAGGHAVRMLSRTPPIAGSKLALKIDAALQAVVYQAFGDRRGALVAIDPATGGVLAFVSKPGFDPNLFVDGIDPQSWEDLNTSVDKPLVNRALAGTYPPGSTFKPYMALAALTYGKRRAEQTINDPGYFNFGGHMFRDDKPGGHGIVDMYKSIVESCDTYYYQLANDLGIDNIARFMAQFGFGSLTGIDIKGEVKGVLPSPEWKMERFKQKWYAGETISVGIGQGYNAYTPLQLAQAIATLANNGVMFRPHVVDYIEDVTNQTRATIEPRPLRTLALKQEDIDVIKHALIGVNQEGTSAAAFTGAEYVAAGKTGTAQVIAIKQGEKYVESRVAERHRDHALYIAYAPADAPKIAVAIVVENAGFGAVAAAPIARQVFDYYLLGKKPTAPAPEKNSGNTND